ncbi:MAG: hypothetical protein ACI8XO_000768 [Verrucomicrobiales bacterium]|jgi:hypothetical protein
MGRNVSLLRQAGGKLLVHSRAEFSPVDLAAIREIGEPAWLLEATNMHDTHARSARAALPDIPYLVPPGFKNAEALGAAPISSASDELLAEGIEIIERQGMPKLREHVIFHRHSKTLVVADLLFNFPIEANWWTRTFLRATAGVKQFPAMSRLLRLYIKDRTAFSESLAQISALDSDRIIVGHGDSIVRDTRISLNRCLLD